MRKVRVGTVSFLVDEGTQTIERNVNRALDYLDQAAALGCDMSAEVAAYRKKRDMVYDALSEPFGLIEPGGAFYAFVPAPDGLTGTQFVEKAIANNVLVIPGNVFSERDTHFRISFTAPEEEMRRGLEILRKLADKI